ncbi:hypothetical protein BH11BAC3_BH11BAC3_39970 [soil metagenome]
MNAGNSASRKRYMKYACTLLMFLLGSVLLFAQRSLPAFGKIDAEDLKINQCSFDPGAAAYKLIDYGNTYYTQQNDPLAPFKTFFERRVRIKILTEAGLSSGNVTIPYYSGNNEEKLVKAEGYTFNLETNETIKRTSVRRKSGYNNKINKQLSEMVLIFPEVKVGSVIEYRYMLQRSSATEIKDWFFQSNMPVAYSEYQVKIPLMFNYIIQPFTADSLETKETIYTNQVRSKTGVQYNTSLQKNFIMRNLVAVHDEPYMGAAKDYLQRVSFQLADIDYGNGNVQYVRSDWEDIVNELMNDQHFGKQLSKTPSWINEILEKALSMELIEKRMAFIYNYITQQMHWNGVNSIYSYEGIRKAGQQKTGSSGDINLLLISLLNKAGIKALPVLFSTRNNGLMDTTLPFLKQFNLVMALVADNENSFILDATNQYADYHLMPVEIVNTNGFVVDSTEGRWLSTADSLHKYAVTTAIKATINTTGLMSGDAWLSYSDYARKPHCEAWLADKEKFKQDYLSNEPSGLKIEKIEVENLKSDTLPLEQHINFSLPINPSGEHYFFSMNLFSELQKNQFMAAERHTDIDFGYRQAFIMHGSYALPDSFEFESVPATVSLIMPDTSITFKRFVNVENNTINVKMTVDYKRPYYTAAAYPDFFAFNKMLLSKLNEQVIFKKKPLP